MARDRRERLERYWEQLEKYSMPISFIVIAMSTSIAARNVSELNSTVGRGFEQLKNQTQAIKDIDDTLKKIEEANDRTKLLNEIAPDLIEVLKTAFGNKFERVDEALLPEKIKNFLKARGIAATDTLVQELTKAALCKVLGVACGPSVTVNSAPITIQPTPVAINNVPAAPPNFPPTMIFEQMGLRGPSNAVSAGSELRLYMSVWFPKTNTTDDQGATEKLIVPRIKRHIGLQQRPVGATRCSGL
jgi:hypothetical protein